ncbi:MAG: hypothetical protein K5925_01430 [Bacilli bacterium]|nr:hypothetical protein [Bacilli bacterium]
MKKVGLFKAILLAVTVLSGAATVAATASWFMPKAQVESDKDRLGGSTMGAYFAYGQGTISQPYGITKPRHLYNLAWLQYLGFFKTQTYFELSDNIDMSGWTLPPIGTPKNPFVGNFNGQGYVVTGLTVSNDFSEYGNQHPASVDASVFNSGDNPATSETTETNNYPNIVGFFGVVGNYNNAFTGTYNSSINEMKNIGLSDITVHTEASNSLIGAAAGYVDAKMENVAVDTATLSIDSGANALTSGPTTKLSDFSIVGYTTRTKKIRKASETIYDVSIDHESEFNVPSGGDGVGWGGSINMYDLHQRLVSVKNNTRTGSNGFTNRKQNYNYRTYWTSTPSLDESTPATLSQYDSDEVEGANDYLSFYKANESEREFGTYALYNRIDNGTVNNQYVYLMGGQNQVTTFTEYYLSTQITDGSGHFMYVATPNNNASVTNTNNQNIATGWVVPSKSTGKIYTVRNNTKYYLSFSDANMSLILRTGEANGKDWTRDDLKNDQGDVLMTRFTTTNVNDQGKTITYYLEYDDGWKLTKMPSPPDNIGVEPPNPSSPDELLWAGKDKYREHGYQISYDRSTQDNTLISYMNDNFETGDVGGVWGIGGDEPFFTSIDNEYTYGWQITNLTNNGTTNIKFGSNYVQIKETDVSLTGWIKNWKNQISFTSNSSSPYYCNWTANKSNTVEVGEDGLTIEYWSFKLTKRSGYRGNTTYYLAPSVGSSGCAFTLSTTQTYLRIVSNDQIISIHDAPIQTTYNQLHGKHEEWVTNTQTYEQEYNGYLDDLENTYAINPNVDGVVRGPDTYTDRNNPNNDRMKYSSDDTSYIPLNVVKDGTYSSMANYEPQKSNTGYIVGGSKLNANTNVFNSNVAGIRVAYYDKSTYLDENSYFYDDNLIANVYTIKDKEASAYSNELLTNPSAKRSMVSAIQENPNTNNPTEDRSAYKKYYRSFKDFQTKLADSGNNIYGLHFDDAQISMDNIVVADKVQISNFYNANSSDKTYTNYELPVNSIDFNLNDRGYINFFAGTYFAGGAEDIVNSFFSIHQVIRDPNNGMKIKEIKEIQAVYSDGIEGHSYILQYKGSPIQLSIPYLYKDGTRYNLNPNGEASQTYLPKDVHIEGSTMYSSKYSDYVNNYGYKMVFNTDWITNFTDDPSTGAHEMNLDISNSKNRLFYFEIPVNEGEYCLGSVPGGLGAYLLYLDIGANASKTQRTTTVEHFNHEEFVYVYPAGVAYIDMSSSASDYTSGVKYISEYDYTNQAFTTDRDIDVIDSNSVCIEINVGYTGDFVVERTSNQVALTKAVTGSDAIYQGDEVTSFINKSDSSPISVTPLSSETKETVKMCYYDFSAYLEDWTMTEIIDTSTNGGAYSRQVIQHLYYGTDKQKNLRSTEASEIELINVYDVIKNNQGEITGVKKYTSSEFMDRSVLVINNNDISSTKLIELEIRQDATPNTSGYIITPTFNYTVVVDPNTSANIIEFDNYMLEFLVAGNQLKVKVIEVANQANYKEVYVGTVSAGNLILTTDAGRTITINVNT